MGRSNIQWLYDELSAWVEKGYVSPEQAEFLRKHYGAPPASGFRSNVALTLVGFLGASLVGLGIILLLAHNWESLSRPMRTVLSFAPLVAAQTLAAYVLLRKRDRLAWREGVGIFWTLSIGASISLIGQTYHIAPDFAGFMLMWTALALPGVYLMRSTSAAAATLLGTLVWISQAESHAVNLPGFLLLMAAHVPFLWMLSRETGGRWRFNIISFAFAACALIQPQMGTMGHAEACVPVLTAQLAAAMMLASAVLFADGRLTGFRIAGGCAAAILGLTMTYRMFWGRAPSLGMALTEPAMVYLAVVTLCNAGACVKLLVTRRRLPDAAWVAVFIVAHIVWQLRFGSTGALVVANAYVLTLGVATLAAGLQSGRLRTVNVGMAVLGLLILMRFFDSDVSFTVRGVGFIAVGLLFLTGNLFLMSRANKLKGARI